VIANTSARETQGAEIQDVASMLSVLDPAYSEMLAGNVESAMSPLFHSLYQASVGMPTDDFRALTAACLEHPIRSLLHQDPYTRHAFERPRGYPGDADLLDFPYGDRPPDPTTTDIGLAVFRWTTGSSASDSVRHRCDLIAGLIDETACRKSNAAVLSIACGHFREGHVCASLSGGGLGRVTCIDGDPETVERVRATYTSSSVESAVASVREMLSDAIQLPTADLVYAAGLYDYLRDRTAEALTSLLFRCVAPGGRLLIANFSPTLPERGYMKVYMRWPLVYRTQESVAALSRRLSASEIGGSRIFTDPTGNVIYHEILRA
jgi:extracellular factor (EF) 3-hydroxypalmitic acid methyl ester biosynthesis protein